jgi:hypothetical protein
MFKGADEVSKMRSYRRLIRRAEPDGREIRLLEATAWRILHYADRTRARLADETDELGEEDLGDGSETAS